MQEQELNSSDQLLFVNEQLVEECPNILFSGYISMRQSEMDCSLEHAEEL